MTDVRENQQLNSALQISNEFPYSLLHQHACLPVRFGAPI